MIDKIVIHETADGLDIRIGIQADFTTHMKIYDGEGKQQADLEVIDQIIPTAMKRRMKPE